MKGFSYFQRLSLAARWLLPQKEAAEMQEDCRDMIAEWEEESAKERFGPPVKAVLAVAGLC